MIWQSYLRASRVLGAHNATRHKCWQGGECSVLSGFAFFSTRCKNLYSLPTLSGSFDRTRSVIASIARHSNSFSMRYPTIVTS
ncbi:hypothetical protein MPTK1_5g10350 [Marchantia polymorpha subsp. ruderalis]|uniref:Uncharacterized protein n=2 Tax=Marchantia polymorpha TaxID=3197 RepID=A0AAF6BGW9_MARPO|nr:hypothetical protein MARPO_0048s0036 [Marchantia polymorpha]BBN11253.1 hypothetical protein Mp_5g10350 [Marchantia polymorpha subsp. ruderalis]|eukprot:PTQ38916.1 hypothetical protein MARPO_0048s0036 [Marchantia polymorpha]